MTNEQAIKDFEGTNENYREQLSKYGYVMDKAEKDVVNQIIERNELAISALSAEEDNTTHWVDGDAICPKCGKNKFDGLDADIWADWKPMYCPNCGRKAVSE